MLLLKVHNVPNIVIELIHENNSHSCGISCCTFHSALSLDLVIGRSGHIRSDWFGNGIRTIKNKLLHHSTHVHCAILEYL